MAKRRSRKDIDTLVKGIAALLILGGAALTNFWKSLTKDNQTIFLILAILAVIAGVVFVVLFIVYRKRRREQTWKRAMAEWHRLQHLDKPVSYRSARYLSPANLEHFAVQVYRKMGYRAQHTGQSGDHGIDVRLVTPSGEVEIVQCKQWHTPVGEKEVRDLLGAMAGERAVKGYLWAPGGFTDASKSWAKGKPILLMDDAAISKLVEASYAES